MRLRSLHDTLGASWGYEGEREVVWNYNSLRVELESLDYGPALLDFSDYGLLEVSGKDALEFVHNQCTSNIKKMPEEGWLETCFLNNRGQVEHAALVVRRGEKLWIAARTAPALAERFRRYIIFDAVEIAQPEGWVLLRLNGLQTGYVARSLTEQFPGVWGVSATEDWVMARDEYGAWLWVLAGKAEALAKALIMAGAKPTGREAWRIWRVERGIADLEDGLGELPQEVGWEYRVSYKKGCYLGQEIMARLEARGNTRYQVMGLLGQKEMFSGSPVLRDGKKVGEVKTSVVSPKLGALALALVRKELNVGDQVQVGETSATLALLPLDLVPGI